MLLLALATALAGACQAAQDAPAAGAAGARAAAGDGPQGSGEGTGGSAAAGAPGGAQAGGPGGPGGPGRGPVGPIPVAVEQPSVGRLAIVLSYPGEVSAEAVVDVAAEVGGRLTAVDVELGQAVDVGQRLAELDDREARDALAQARAQLAVSQAQVEQARVALDDAQEEVERNRPLQQRGLVTDQQFAALEAQVDAARSAQGVAEAQVDAARAAVHTAQTALDQTQVSAPFAGRIAAVQVDPGAVVSAGAPLFRLVSAERLVLRLAVNEEDVSRLHVGQPARVHLNAFPDATVDGQVARIGAQLDPQSRALPLEVALQPGDLPVLDGMSGTVEIETASAENALLLPRGALHDGPDGGRAVWVQRSGHAVEVPVEVGLSDGERAEILSGVDAETQVIVRGQTMVREGSEVVVR